jgi:hypothetical protein
MLSRLTRNVLNVKLNKSYSTYYKIIPKDRIYITSKPVLHNIHQVDKNDILYNYILNTPDKICINEVTNKNNIDLNTIRNSQTELLEFTDKHFVYSTKDQLFKHPNITGDTIVNVIPADHAYNTTTFMSKMKYTISKRIFISDPKPLFSLDTLRELNLENEVNTNYAYAAIYNNSLEGITIAKNYIKYIKLFTTDEINTSLRFPNLSVNAFRLILTYRSEHEILFTNEEFVLFIMSNKVDFIFEIYKSDQFTYDFINIVIYASDYEICGVSKETRIFLKDLREKINE